VNNHTFENLEIGQDAIELAAHVYERLQGCRDFGFRDQMQEASASVSNHMAEGYERDSNQEFILWRGGVPGVSRVSSEDFNGGGRAMPDRRSQAAVETHLETD
jgi:hypothetical protein